MIRRTVIACIVLALVSSMILFAGLITVPVEEEGVPGLTETSRFYIVSNDKPDKEIRQMVRMMDAQFAAAGVPTQTALPVFYGDREDAKAGDIVVSLDPDFTIEQPKITDQSYRISPAKDGALEITAAAADGLWYGMMDLLQRCRAGKDIPRETIVDGPECAERTLMLDCGRKFYSAEWIKNLIKRMSWQKYTSLQLHFSDAEGMHFESKLYPWLNEEEYLSFEDLESICAVAGKYNIEIIPELDSPGHLNYIVQRYAAHALEDPAFEFEYDGETYRAADEGGSSISNYYSYMGGRSAYTNKGIDLSNEVARAFMYSLIDEYADFFAKQGCTRFGIGGDELFGWVGATVGGRSFGSRELWYAQEHWAAYAREELGIENGSAADTFISYLNDLDTHLREKGYSCRVWNDELHRIEEQTVELNQDIEIIYWTNDYTPMEDLIRNGNRILSSNTDWCYYVIRMARQGGDIMDSTRKYCNTEYIYENWDPHNCATPREEETMIPEESLAGGFFCIWSDSPNYKTEEIVWDDTEYRTWANAAKLWDHDAEDQTSYKKFRKHLDKIGTFPGYSGSCEEPSSLPKASQIQHQKKPGFWDNVKQRFSKEEE